MAKTTNLPKTDLALYRLEPVPSTLERDEWAASTLKETCWVQAASEREARALVESETRVRQSQANVKLPFFSPWASSTFSSCHKEEGEVPGDIRARGGIYVRRAATAEGHK